MIIKRSQKSEMPHLKRCRERESACEDDGAPRKSRKKRKPSYPLDLLGDVAAGRIPLFSDGILRQRVISDHEDGSGAAASWSTEVSYCSGEAESESKRRGKGGGGKNSAAVAFRPPLVRTSRGRVQVLPSRFNDSVLLDPWKKDRPKSKAFDPILDGGLVVKECKEEKFSCKKPKFDAKEEKRNGKFNCRNPKLYTLVKQEEEEEEAEDELGFRNLDFKKNSTSRSSLTSLHEQFIEVEKKSHLALAKLGKCSRLEAERVQKEESTEKRKDSCKWEEFAVGDIVWARPGKMYPAWPAIVIDPTLQAPEMVLNCGGVTGAICVMFFRRTQNGKERVNKCCILHLNYEFCDELARQAYLLIFLFVFVFFFPSLVLPVKLLISRIMLG